MAKVARKRKATTRPKDKTTPVADEVLAWLRRLQAALPETGEKASWGHPNFTVAGKIYAAVEPYKDEWAVCFKAPRELQQELVQQSDQFYVAPYVGKQGWTSMRLEAGMNWGLLKTLVLNSYRMVAPKTVLKKIATGTSSARRAPASRRP
jgi:predicted DNA-binding protein (MmcQ/YjbR family)